MIAILHDCHVTLIRCTACHRAHCPALSATDDGLALRAAPPAALPPVLAAAPPAALPPRACCCSACRPDPRACYCSAARPAPPCLLLLHLPPCQPSGFASLGHSHSSLPTLTCRLLAFHPSPSMPPTQPSPNSDSLLRTKQLSLKHESNQPTNQSTNQPANQPTSQPANQSTDQPTSQPTKQPTKQPTNQPAHPPTHQPANQASLHDTPRPPCIHTHHPFPTPSTTPPTAQLAQRLCPQPSLPSAPADGLGVLVRVTALERSALSS